MAGAVFLLQGSNNIAPGSTLIYLSCSAVINLCSSLQTIIGFSQFSKPFILFIVVCRNVEFLLLFIARYCFGKLFLERGQSLEPVPPQRIIGSIALLVFKSFILTVNHTKHSKYSFIFSKFLIN